MNETTYPFQNRKGKDLYETNNALYYTLNIILWIYAVGYVAWIMIPLLTNITHTFFLTPGMPGELFSIRYSSLTWIFLMLSALRLFVPIAVRIIIIFRKSNGCTITWLVILGLLVIVDFLVWVVLAALYSNCNEDGFRFNICNDPLYCCVFWDNAFNMCENSTPCTPAVTVDQLQPDGLFLWAFWTSLIFVILDWILLLIPVVLWIKRKNPKWLRTPNIIRAKNLPNGRTTSSAKYKVSAQPVIGQTQQRRVKINKQV